MGKESIFGYFIHSVKPISTKKKVACHKESAEQPEDLILQLLQFPLAGGDADHQSVLLFFELWTLLTHHNPQ